MPFTEVTADWVFWIRAGLAMVTATPGSRTPAWSVTRPLMIPVWVESWAESSEATKTRDSARKLNFFIFGTASFRVSECHDIPRFISMSRAWSRGLGHHISAAPDRRNHAL